jgi:hypothetical protein
MEFRITGQNLSRTGAGPVSAVFDGPSAASPFTQSSAGPAIADLTPGITSYRNATFAPALRRIRRRETPARCEGLDRFQEREQRTVPFGDDSREAQAALSHEAIAHNTFGSSVAGSE